MEAPPAPEKLTKKQRKAAAFRERKGKGKDVAEQLDVPESDVTPDDIVPPTPLAAKRKREEDEPVAAAAIAKKAKKDPSASAGETSKAKPKVEGKKNHRYILFVGASPFKLLPISYP